MLRQLRTTEITKAFVEMATSAEDRSDGQKLALLTLRRNDLSHQCIELLKAASAKLESKHFRELIEARLAARGGAHNYILLTPIGLAQANRLALSIARANKLHHFETSSGRFDLTVRCTCGWSTSLSKNQGHLVTGQMRARSYHIAQIEAQAWPKIEAANATMVPELGDGQTQETAPCTS